MSVWAVNADHFVVHLETFNSLDLFESLLEVIFEVHRQAAIIVVKLVLELFPVLVERALKKRTERVEKHGDLEASNARFEANLCTTVLQNDLLVLELLVSVVKLGNLANNPESLPVQLLFKVPIEEIFH